MTKNFKGGYKIVSLNGNDLTSESTFTIKGIYEDLRDSYSKPILVTDIVIDDEKQQDAYAVVKKTDSGYSIEVYGYALAVTDEDSVTSEALPEITSIGDGLTLEDGELSAYDSVTSIGGVSGEITLGSGLSITEEGELSASGGGGSTLYQHFINIYANVTDKIYCNITLITTSSDKINTPDKIKAIIGDSVYITASGALNGDGGKTGVIYEMCMSTSLIYFHVKDFTTSDKVTASTNRNAMTYTDTVIQIS